MRLYFATIWRPTGGNPAAGNDYLLALDYADDPEKKAVELCTKLGGSSVTEVTLLCEANYGTAPKAGLYYWETPGKDSQRLMVGAVALSVGNAQEIIAKKHCGKPLTMCLRLVFTTQPKFTAFGEIVSNLGQQAIFYRAISVEVALFLFPNYQLPPPPPPPPPPDPPEELEAELAMALEMLLKLSAKESKLFASKLPPTYQMGAQ